jgi:hypothetical protein
MWIKCFIVRGAATLAMNQGRKRAAFLPASVVKSQGCSHQPHQPGKNTADWDEFFSTNKADRNPRNG